MVKVTDKNFYMDGYLKSNLEIAKKAIKKDWDMVFVVDGMEGSGKSVLAMQIGYYFDPTLHIGRICFGAKEFQDKIKGMHGEKDKFKCVIYDEAFGGMSAKRAMSKVNHSLQKMMSEIRKKNLYIIIVLPTFFELQKYHAIWRSRALIHVYDVNFDRGRFLFFNADRKKNLYLYGKKFYNYNATKSNFRGAFGDFYTVDKTEYKAKKDLEPPQEEEVASRWKKAAFGWNNYAKTVLKLKYEEIANIENEYTGAEVTKDAIRMRIRRFS